MSNNNWTCGENGNLISMTGVIKYTGPSQTIVVNTSGYTLNGEFMEVGRKYPLHHGDFINDENHPGLDSESIKWVFD